MTATYELIPKPEDALELFEPDPRTVYTIEATARLVDLPRHTILVYYKRGLVSPVAGPEGLGYCFNKAGIRRLRRIEHLRNIDGLNLNGIKMILGLMTEVERLQAEVRFLRE
jgi:DNA-binding transcriptional MerR regulator